VKIYTRSGDGGATGLFGGQRVAKTHPRVEAYGAVDELNACLGLVAAVCAPDDDDLRGRLARVQSRLFDIGSDLATPPASRAGSWIARAQPEWATELEADIDRMEAELPPLTSFILPGGNSTAAALHFARTVCRRAERRVVGAREAGEEVSEAVSVYLNRLSDWLFVAARWANARAGVAEVPWTTDGPAAP
jgi:cob(I)alamin adenosyltransferase